MSGTAPVTISVDDQIKQLDNARKLVLGDVSYYGQVVQGVLPIIGPSAHVKLRRWGSDFLAEVFSSPALPSSQKETLSLLVLETLKSLIEDPKEDSFVVTSAIQTCASVYPLAFKWMCVSHIPSCFLPAPTSPRRFVFSPRGRGSSASPGGLVERLVACVC